MFHLKSKHLVFLAGLVAPVCGFASNYCIAVSGGFGNGGTSFIAPDFAIPAAGSCSAWAGFTKAFTTVVVMSSGTGCLSTNGKVLTVSVSSADPALFGPDTIHSDYIQLCPAGVKGCPVADSDQGEFGGPAATETCTTKLLMLPQTHD